MNNDTNIIHLTGFDPIFGKILILGTSVGKKSMQLGFFYMDNRNCFWQMLDEAFYKGQAVFQELKKEYVENSESRKTVIDSIKEKLAFNNIGISDIFESCYNKDSSKDSGIILDNQLYPFQYNKRLKELIENADYVILNGISNFNYSHFCKAVEGISISDKKILRFYSTSNANNGHNIARLEQWRSIKNLL